ncbi:ELM1/GtrOC1 family putative glycosyltransferase [Pokkaliibacter sp. CJK22405]|uniref:ELM1/GtrOC1 family putative glycosyltransferase n=1 Tax=Pokkaliibacter sp. CJK22405 TaxID=3384615 RepID=UPI003984EBD8
MTRLFPERRFLVTHLCIVSDGKPGHLNQSLGLAAALKALRPSLEITEVSPLSRGQQVRCWLGKTQPLVTRPALILGAGHRTHSTVLALRHSYGVPGIVLMSPSLPYRFFDLCLVPEHDQPPARENVVTTQGMINRMHAGTKDPHSGLILVGGPSKECDWDETALLSQITALLEQPHAEPVNWQVATSRRTPQTTVDALTALGCSLVLPEEVDRDWLPATLARTTLCWVSEDSASMVFEALTAGCRVGVFSVPRKRQGRVYHGVQNLIQREQVGVIHAGQPVVELPGPQRLEEASRCARLIVDRGWL